MLFWFFFFNDTATTEIYTLSLHDALPIWAPSANPQLADHYVWLNPSVRGNPKLLVFMPGTGNQPFQWSQDRKSTRLNSSHVRISYAVFCLKKKTRTLRNHTHLLTAL